MIVDDHQDYTFEKFISDYETGVTLNHNQESNIDNELESIYVSTQQVKDDNKEMMADIMEKEADLSKIIQLEHDIQAASKLNNELMAELEIVLKYDNKSIRNVRISSTSNLNKYEETLQEIQNQVDQLNRLQMSSTFNSKTSPVKETPVDVQTNNDEILSKLDLEVEEKIYKEQQDTKILRLRYEKILDNLDKQIEDLTNSLQMKKKLIFTKTQKLRGVLRIKTHIFIKQKSEINSNYGATTEMSSPVIQEKIEKEHRYKRMKEIKRKYSRIVLVRGNTLQEKLEMKKASHSLDLGVPRGNTIYKPEFKLRRLTEKDSHNGMTQSFKERVANGEKYNVESIRINIKPNTNMSNMPTIFDKRKFYNKLKLGNIDKTPAKSDSGVKRRAINKLDNSYDFSEGDFDRWRKIMDLEK